MKLSTQDVEHIAKLARLSLTPEEIQSYAEELSVIFGYVEMLNDVDTSGIAETCQVTGLHDVIREDVIVECHDDIQQNIKNQFPERVGDLLKVKAVFE